MKDKIVLSKQLPQHTGRNKSDSYRIEKIIATGGNNFEKIIATTSHPELVEGRSWKNSKQQSALAKNKLSLAGCEQRREKSDNVIT